MVFGYELLTKRVFSFSSNAARKKFVCDSTGVIAISKSKARSIIRTYLINRKALTYTAVELARYAEYLESLTDSKLVTEYRRVRAS